MMSAALWMVFFAGILPVLTVVFAKAAGGSYDNAHPRAWAAGLTGFRARAHAAHLNHFEFFPFFAVGVLVAEWKAGGGTSLNGLALVIMASRLAYTFAYFMDHPALRSLAWAIAWFGTIGIFLLAARGA
ncbi:COG3686 Predicted membrane protein [Rhabdaerophilaceae bacterium]